MIPTLSRVPAMLPADVAKVTELESHAARYEQIPLVTRHLIHAGQYHRTITVPAGAMITGAVIKRATTLTISGHVCVYVGNNESREIAGYHVIPASAGRKQAFLAIEDTHITMSFPTLATTVSEAEAEFTDETDKLMSRELGDNVIVITGE